MRSILRFAASRVRERDYERLLAYSVLKANFAKEIDTVITMKKREEVWDRALALSSKTITYVEFGVYGGDSIKFFSAQNKAPSSIFIGLDSFEGLPEDWGHVKKGSFDMKGAVPRIDDTRVKFIKGWFQNTWTDLVGVLPDDGDLIVHYDADLYSSTLFALTKIDSLKRSYLAIFDEFHGHEARALRAYQQAYNPKLRFLAKTVAGGYPFQVLCKIDPS